MSEFTDAESFEREARSASRSSGGPVPMGRGHMAALDVAAKGAGARCEEARVRAHRAAFDPRPRHRSGLPYGEWGIEGRVYRLR